MASSNLLIDTLIGLGKGDQADAVAQAQNPRNAAIAATQDAEDAAAGPAGIKQANDMASGQTPLLEQQQKQQVFAENNGLRAMIDRIPPAAQKEISNPDMPYAKAAAWNAFFGNLATGGSGAAIAAYANTYGRALQKMSDHEAEYNAQRDLVNRAAKDTIADYTSQFEAQDPFIASVVKGANGDVNRIKAVANAARQSGSPDALALSKLVEEIDNVETQRRENLLYAANYSGKVKATENGEINGQPVTKIVTESGKVQYKDANGKVIANPSGFKSEKQLEGIENRKSRESLAQDSNALRLQISQGNQAIAGMSANIAAQNAQLRREQFEEENKIGPLKGGGYRDPDGIVYTGSEMAKYRSTTKELQVNLIKLKELTEQDFKDAQSPIDWTNKPNEVRTAAQRKTLEAQTKIKDAQVQQTLQNLPPGPASDTDVRNAASGFPGFSNAKALGSWKDRSVRGSQKGLSLMQEQFPGGIHISKEKSSEEVIDASSLPGAPKK